MRHKQRILVALICIASASIWYFVASHKSVYAKTSALTIVCTTGMIADVVRAVGGPYVSVTCLMGPAIDPHLYRAREGDVHRLASANIIFYNGLHLEGKMSHVLGQMSRYSACFAVTDTIPRHLLRAPVGFDDTFDPHVWLDVSLWCYTVRYVCDILVCHDAQHAHAYKKNALEYLNVLQQLDDYVRAKTAQLPAGKRMLVTAHDAFYYFGARYGFQVVGLQGISTESEAGIKDMSNLVDFLVANHVPAIFLESSISQRAIQAVQCATRARGFDVAIGPELFSDALGNPGTPEATYVGMIKHNIDAIVAALNQ